MSSRRNLPYHVAMSDKPPLSVLGICGSLRSQSYNRALLRAAQTLSPPDMHITLHELHEIPLYNDDVYAQGAPDGVVRFRQAIAAADALLISAPEYNYSISGVLKNALDWASRSPNPPLDGKPLGLMGCSPGPHGTARGQMATRQVCIFTNMVPLNKPELLVPKAHEKFDKEGNLTDEDTRQRLGAFLAAFSQHARRWLGRP